MSFLPNSRPPIVSFLPFQKSVYRTAPTIVLPISGTRLVVLQETPIAAIAISGTKTSATFRWTRRGISGGNRKTEKQNEPMSQVTPTLHTPTLSHLRWPTFALLESNNTESRGVTKLPGHARCGGGVQLFCPAKTPVFPTISSKFETCHRSLRSDLPIVHRSEFATCAAATASAIRNLGH